jgi:hypothetical protein
MPVIRATIVMGFFSLMILSLSSVSPDMQFRVFIVKPHEPGHRPIAPWNWLSSFLVGVAEFKPLI